ncbi:hypothetical protein PG996_010210 [Apiospora saccharicola]|uniref:SRPBCC domain-containing protein n=1 Tax=Apiospora saccharicola TaxID=335842 RepID=A0ABR1UMX0_9PEZI
MGLSEPIFNRAEIEIRAPPALVRTVLMDFARYRDWTHKSRWSITADKSVQDLKPGDSLRVDLGGMSFRPTLVDIMEDSFAWDGSLWGLLVGRHYFHVLPSKKTPGGTLFVQKEEWTGPLSVRPSPTEEEEAVGSWPWLGYVQRGYQSRVREKV